MSSLLDRPADRPADRAAGAAGIDPRGPQFTATLTAVVLVAALVTPTPISVVLTALQAVLFLIGATRGVQHTPHAWLFRTLVRPRLAPPADLEDPRPPRFAQAVGLTFMAIALVAFALIPAAGSSAHAVALIALGLALVAAVLNAAFRFCLGCELYLLTTRLAR